MRFLAQGLTLDAMTLAIPLLALAYRARVTMPRPPVGVFTRSDIVIMLTLLVVMPYAYLHLPITVVIAFFGLVMFGMIRLTLTPVLGGRTSLLAALVLCATAVTSWALGWHASVAVVNDLILILVVVGVTNMWAQTGITPGQVAGLAAALAVYDLITTGMSTTTATFVGHVLSKPFAPLLMGGFTKRRTFLGMGDCILLTIWPLAAGGKYGKRAASLAVAVDVLLIASIRIGFLTGILSGQARLMGVLISTFPVATPLGIFIVIQYLFWKRKIRPQAPVRGFLDSALRPLPGADTARGEWAASHDGKVVATGYTPGTARKAARLAGLIAVPVTSLSQRPGKPEDRPDHPVDQPDREYAGSTSGHAGSPR